MTNFKSSGLNVTKLKDMGVKCQFLYNLGLKGAKCIFSVKIFLFSVNFLKSAKNIKIYFSNRDVDLGPDVLKPEPKSHSEGWA